MRVAILGQKGSWHVEQLQSALDRRGIAAPCFSITQLTARAGEGPRLSVGGYALDQLDLVFLRGIPGGSLEQVIFRVDAMHCLENSGVRVINRPVAIERTVDKYYTSTLLQDAGLSTPRTAVTENLDQALAAFAELGEDVVIKPLFGSEGRGMVRVCDQDTARRVLLALDLGRYVYYLQEFVPHGTEDIRVFVTGGQVTAAMVRRGVGWKTNVAQGAAAVPLSPEPALCDLALKATAAVGADYAGVDVLATPSGYSVIEVNGIPGWQGLQSVTPFSIVDSIVDYALEQFRKGFILQREDG